jgi:hypothetical protein
MDLNVLKEIEPWQWPEGLSRRLLTILRNPKAAAEERLLAAEFAGDFTLINDDLAAALLAILIDPGEPDELRAQAAISFGAALEQADTDQFDDPESVPITEKMFLKIKASLSQLYRESGLPKLLRRRVLEVSVRAQEEWHPAAIRSAWSDPDPEWKLTAIFCMGYVRGFDQQILEALGSADPQIHAHAVEAAGNWEVEAAWPHIAALAENLDADKDLRLTAIEALSNIGAEESVAILADLCEDADEDIAEAASDAMSMAEGRLGGEFDDEFDGGEDEDGDDEEAPF